MQTKNSKFILILAALSFILPLILIYSYNFSEKTIIIFGVELKKLSPKNHEPYHNSKKALKISKELKLKQRKTHNNNSSHLIKKTHVGGDLINDTIQFERVFNDSVSERILIMGDSQSGGLFHELNDYCVENNHQLVMSFIWNSATILNFAYSDTVASIINKYKPTYIFIVIGLNEMYAKDIKKRKSAALVLAEKLEGIPYSWIGPANYMTDFGINDVFRTSAQPGTFFSSKDLNLPKGGDKRHPSSKGYQIWMNAIANWVENYAKYPLVMNTPKKRNRPYRSKVISLNAATYRGY